MGNIGDVMRALGLVVAVAACSSSSPSGGISGQLPGGSFQLEDTVSATITTSDGAGGTSSSARIVLASIGGVCPDAAASPPIARMGQRFIEIDLRDVTGATATAPAAPGSYTIYPDTGSEPPHSASLVTGGLDATCQPDDVHAAMAQSGTVTLTSITGGAFTGSFDVTLNTGGMISGSFSPAPCPALATAAAAMTVSCE